MEHKLSYYPLNSFRVCIDSIDPDVKGNAYSPLQKEEVTFNGVGELIIKMDQLFDAIGYPQGFQDKRSFGRKKEYWNLHKGIPQYTLDQKSILEKSGILKTMDIMVKSRKNTSWQGEIYDDKGNYISTFAGEVGLFNLINSILQQS